ncbi:hypothetical protein RHIZ404_230427 [Rhizobium sp. EC-SD404]|nr:hypothetical protein RHIZ404_230427 [Rhizobium sp. EC-SD404]
MGDITKNVKPDDRLARAILKTCQQSPVRSASASFPQFQLDSNTSDSMLELLARLDQVSRGSCSDRR